MQLCDRLRPIDYGSALQQSALHRLFTRTERCLVRVIEFNMSMCRFVLLNQFTIMLEIAVALFLLYCLKLKSGIIKRIFPTILKSYVCVYCNSAMTDPSDAMKPVRFAGGNFRRWQTRVKFLLMSMELWWVSIYAIHG